MIYFRPLFLQLRFDSHADAWEAYFQFQKDKSLRLYMRARWCKTQWYHVLASKMKKVSHDTLHNRILQEIKNEQEANSKGIEVITENP